MTTSADRIAVVTGAGSGLGRATALRLSRDGFAVACLDVAADTAEATAGQIAGAGGRALAVACDVSDEDSVGAAFAAVHDGLGGIDVLATVAGIGLSARLLDTTPAQWRRVLDVNLTGTFLTVQAGLADLLARRGSVITVASVAALRGWRYMSAYSASKAGIVAFTRTVAVEFGGNGVRANCVCPGSIDTPLKDALRPVEGADPALMSRGPALLDPPVAQPVEIADTIGYLASPEARFITGTVLTIDGGAMA